MQKLLNTHPFARYSLLVRQMLLGANISLLKGLALVVILVSFSSPVHADSGTGFVRDYVVVNGGNNTNGNVFYYTNKADNVNPAFTGADLGSYDRGSGRLLLGGQANTHAATTRESLDNIYTPNLYYRVYLKDTTPGAFSSLTLNYKQAGVDGADTKQWENVTNIPNLIANTNGPGDYILEVYFQAHVEYSNAGGSGSFSISDNNNYKAKFTVTGSVPASWIGGTNNNDWFTDANWSTGHHPTETTDVVIPYSSGTANYPIISSPTGFFLTAETRDLRIEGTTDPVSGKSVQGARLFLRNSLLRVHGDFIDANLGFSQGEGGGKFAMSGNTPQQFSGGTFIDFALEGGSTKTLLGKMTVTSTLRCGSGILITDIDNPETSGVDLSGVNARIVDLNNEASLGENENSYISGIVRSISASPVLQGVANSFGNIGVELTSLDNYIGSITVTRFTRVYQGIGKSLSINRSFVFSPSSSSGSTNNFNLVFHYLNRDLNNGSYLIVPENLRLFRSIDGGIPFQSLDRSSNDPTAKTLTRNNITGTLFATFTLGDVNNPLPVSLTTLTVAKQNNDAVLDWGTVQEINSKGYEVQVSIDGTLFRTLAFIASETPNSNSPRIYQYIDRESSKSGQRYYRLRQLDLDGKESFYGPLALEFGSSLAGATQLQGYPNPFSSEINLILPSAATAGTATISLLDNIGRQVRTTQSVVPVGSSSLQVIDLQTLPRGLYVVQVRFSDGKTQRLKLVKN